MTKHHRKIFQGSLRGRSKHRRSFLQASVREGRRFYTSRRQRRGSCTSSVGVRARPASCTPDDTASRRLQDIYKKADAAEVVSWQFFGFHIIKTSEGTNHSIRHLHPILSEGNPSASHNTLPMPPRDSNITSCAPLVSRNFLDISATRGGVKAETRGGG